MTQIKSPAEAGVSAHSPSTSSTNMVDVLVLGAGWTYQFLHPLLQARSLTFAATTRNGHDSTISFRFDPTSKDKSPYSRLPSVRTILITFPLTGHEQSKTLVELYTATHPQTEGKSCWIQLGSTGIYKNEGWNDHKSPYQKDSPRAIAEDELLQTLESRVCVLNLAGLYGGERQPKNWIGRVAKTKEDVKGKGALHLIHGNDVARAIIAAHESLTKSVEQRSGGSTVGGDRWIITDLHSYDWWDLFIAWGHYARKNAQAGISESERDAEALQYERWVTELMLENGVRSLPRDKERMGRLVDGRAFWAAVKSWPLEGRVES